ncbi:MAG: hypothetical protein ABSD03_11010 [Vulcanimicrobiaceae bacterium]|jgi:hypothetical protein
MKLWEFEPDVLIAAVDEADAVAVLHEQLGVEYDPDDEAQPELRILGVMDDPTVWTRGVLDPSATEDAYRRLRDVILR